MSIVLLWVFRFNNRVSLTFFNSIAYEENAEKVNWKFKVKTKDDEDDDASRISGVPRWLGNRESRGTATHRAYTCSFSFSNNSKVLICALRASLANGKVDESKDIQQPDVESSELDCFNCLDPAGQYSHERVKPKCSLEVCGRAHNRSLQQCLTTKPRI